MTAFSLTGYSGGGKKMIAQYEGDKGQDLYAPRQYGLVQQHKHLPEIVTICHLTQEPVFTPIVDDYYSGMEVMIPSSATCWRKKVTAHDVWQAFGQPLRRLPLRPRPSILAKTRAASSQPMI